MQDVKKILVPTDFSNGARQALRHAVVLADRLGAELHVLYVVDNAASDDRSMVSGWEAEAIRIAMQADVQRYHHNLMERRQPGRLLARCVVRRGDDIADTILAYANEQRVDLIVIDWYENEMNELSSAEGTAGRVVRQAPCEVLTSGLRGYYATARGAVDPPSERDRGGSYANEARQCVT